MTARVGLGWGLRVGGWVVVNDCEVGDGGGWGLRRAGRSEGEGGRRGGLRGRFLFVFVVFRP